MSQEVRDILEEYGRLVENLVLSPSLVLHDTYNEETRKLIERLCDVVIRSFDDVQQRDYDFCLKKLLPCISGMQNKVHHAINRKRQLHRLRGLVPDERQLSDFFRFLLIRNFDIFHEEISSLVYGVQSGISRNEGILRAIGYEIERVTHFYIQRAVKETDKNDIEERFRRYESHIRKSIEIVCRIYEKDGLVYGLDYFKKMLIDAHNFIRMRIKNAVDQNEELFINWPDGFENINWKLSHVLPKIIKRLFEDYQADYENILMYNN